MFRTVTATGAGWPTWSGERTTTWLKETETTVASSAPKKTWTPPPTEKPEPTIVTRVPPSPVPEDGRSDAICGVPASWVP